MNTSSRLGERSLTVKSYFNQSKDESDLRGKSDQLGVLNYASHILHRTSPLTNSTFLDFGCGDGVVTSAIKSLRPDLQVYGTDIAENLIERAKENYPNISFLSLQDLYEKNKDHLSFDVICSFSVAQYLSASELFDASNKLAGYLNPDGKMAHLSIPLRSKQMVLEMSRRIDGGDGVCRSFLAAMYNLAKSRLNGDLRFNSADGSVYHDPSELRNIFSRNFDSYFFSNSDSWYRFDILLRSI